MKCAKEHKTSECSTSLTRDQIQCALCGENHTSNYKGCRVYKSIATKNKLTAKPNEHPSKAPSNIPAKDPKVVPGKTYADTVSMPILDCKQSDDIKELKDMVKELLSQVSNMMNFMMNILNKLNVSIA